jgi:tellurite resistance protein TerC
MPTDISLFPFQQYLAFYALFVLGVIFLLFLDLGVFHRKAHRVGVKEALGWSAFWISLAVIFGFGFKFYCDYALPLDPRLAGLDHAALSKEATLQFFTGFIVEKALAVDNLFVFVVIFSYLRIPPEFQHRVLALGIIGALVFRAIFIALGAILLQYHWVIVVFGVFLIFTGIKLFVHDNDPDPGKSKILKFIYRILPATNEFHGQKFVIRNEAGKWLATPLLVALLFIEFSDIIFAVDSVPAIFAITKEPLIVFTSNVFAILGLRALYFLVADIVDRFYLLKYALGGILIFVGLKMAWLNDAFGGKFPISWSLGIIGALLAGSIILSLLIPQKKHVEIAEAPSDKVES